MRIELRIARSGGPAGRPGRPAQAERRVRPSARARRAEGRIDLFRLDVPANDSVLSALVRVYECLDSTLAFRYACGKIKCGECGVVVNGTPCLACRKLVEPLLVVESLPGLPLVRDLVVDRTAVLRDLLEHTRVLAEGAGGPDAPRPAVPASAPQPSPTWSANDIALASDCCECLLCQSACPVWRRRPDAFPGPLGLLWLAQAGGPQATQQVLPLCTGCGRCIEVCPSDKGFLRMIIPVQTMG